MKVIFIKRTTILSFLIISITFFTISYSIYNLSLKKKSISTFSPINSDTSIDINADGNAEILKINNSNISLAFKNKTINFSSYYNNKSLTSSPFSWPIKAYAFNLSRRINPELILQTNNNKHSNIAVFQYYNDKLTKIYSEDKNIFGILNLNTSKTPTCYAMNSSQGNSSLKSFMISNNEIIDTTKYYKEIPGIDNILTFINLVEQDFEIDIAPDIFMENIDSNQLGILWNLSKENFAYSFQDAFFTNDFIDNEGNITSMIWRITFEKYNKNSDSNKNEAVFLVTTELNDDNNYKISGISLNK